MARLLSPDDKCCQVDDVATGRRYVGKSFDVSDPGTIRSLRAAGYTVADVSGVPSRAAGFDCECGFKSFFKVCSRCGSECERPTN